MSPSLDSTAIRAEDIAPSGRRLSSLHRALVRVCVVPDTELPDAVAELDREAGGTLTTDHLDHAARELLGHVARRFTTAGIDHPAAPELTREYKRTWHRTQVLVHRARPLFAEIDRHSGPPLVLKGGAMASTAYHDDLGVRPLMDLDVFVDQPTVEPVVDWAIAHGWQVTKGLDTRDIYLVHHAIDLADGKGGAVDVHWALLVQDRSPSRDRAAVAEGIPARLGGIDITVLPPTTQLFHTAAHAKPEGIRHVVDAISIVNRHGAEVDWGRIETEVAERRTVTYALETFGLVEQVMPGTIPAELIARLHRRRRHWSDYAFHGESFGSHRELLRRFGAEVAGRARGRPVRDKVRVAAAMVHRYREAYGLSARDVAAGLFSRGGPSLPTEADQRIAEPDPDEPGAAARTKPTGPP